MPAEESATVEAIITTTKNNKDPVKREGGDIKPLNALRFDNANRLPVPLGKGQGVNQKSRLPAPLDNHHRLQQKLGEGGGQNLLLAQQRPLSFLTMYGAGSGGGGSQQQQRPPPAKKPNMMQQPPPLPHQQQQQHRGPPHHRMPHPPPQQAPPGGLPTIPPHHQQQAQVPQHNPFPQCANDVLVHVGEFVKQRGLNPNKGWNRVKVKELQNLLDQDLFCLSADRRGTRLNPLQYLRLLGIVCNYFEKEVTTESDPKLRYLHFDIIFCGREGEALLHEARVQFLIKLCSLATQFPVYGLFEHIAHWLSKVTSDELKRSYAEQIVGELVEGFVFGPKKNELYKYLLPLVEYSFEFCANFIVFSITEETVGPVLTKIIGEWLVLRTDQFLHYLSHCVHLSHAFCAQKLNLLLRYDCSSEAAIKGDEDHLRMHYVLVKLIAGWRQVFEITQQPQQLLKRPGAFNNASAPQSSFFNQPPVVSSVEEAFQRIDSLSQIAQIRVLEHSVNAARANFFPSFEAFKPRLGLVGKTELSGPQGTLWNSLVVMARVKGGNNNNSSWSTQISSCNW